METYFEPDGRLPLFPQLAYSVPYRLSLRYRNDLDARKAIREEPSYYLPPVMLPTLPVLLVDQTGAQELLNGPTLETHVLPPTAIACQAYCVIELPVTNWCSRVVDFLRFYYRRIEPARMGVDDAVTGEPAWKVAIREIVETSWLSHFLSQRVLCRDRLTNAALSRLLWHQVSPRTVASYKADLRKARAQRRVVSLDDFR